MDIDAGSGTALNPIEELHDQERRLARHRAILHKAFCVFNSLILRSSSRLNRLIPVKVPTAFDDIVPAAIVGAEVNGMNLRQAVRLVALLNLAYFGVEFAVALSIGSVSLFADSIDFLEDASINFLILIALGWSAARRAAIGTVLAGILLVPGLATLGMAWHKFSVPVAPAPIPLTLTGLGALAINLSCAFTLVRHRHAAGSLTKAAFLSARNDAIANVAIIGAGIGTALTLSAWPDLIVGLGIAGLNADAAREVYRAARTERDLAGLA
ncbi:MAG TPA: cation transporter [Stellaceae bacterium]|nr:cation transporter [Stellaceae bacterium]